MTPTASAAVDMKNTASFNVRTMDEKDEIWTIEADHRTGWKNTFKSGTYRGMLYGVILRGCPKQVVSLTKAKSVPMNMSEFFSWAHRHYIRLTCKICGTVRKEDRHPQRQDPATCSHRRTDHRESNTHTRKTYCIDCGICLDFVPREIFNALETPRSVSSNRNEELADRVTKDTTITKRQIDLATRMMLDQISRLSDGDCEQSMAIQLFLDCIYRATTPSTAFVSFRERYTHFNDNRTLSLRVVDPIADEGVWAIDDGCNSCCHGKVWRQNGEAKMKVLRLQLILVHRKATTFNGVGTSTTSGKLKNPMAIRLQESDMVMPVCVHSHEIPKEAHP